MKRITEKEREMLWGERGPYSEVQIVFETRILDDSVSRRIVEIRGNINPTTMKIIKKNKKAFEDDEIVLQLVNSARYMNRADGYIISGGAFELTGNDEKLLQFIDEQLEYTKEAVIRMHAFVLDYLKI